MRTLMRLINFLLAMFSLPLVGAFAVEVGHTVVQHGAYYVQNPFTWGFLSSLLLFFLIVVVAGQMSFFGTLIHELAHVVTAFIFFGGKVGPLRVERNAEPPREGEPPRRGEVSIERPNFLIGLAPYYLPLLTVPLLIARPFMRTPANLYVDFAIGVTLAFHYVRLIDQARIVQSDFVQAGGLWFSACVTALICSIIFAVALATVRSDYQGLSMYFIRSWERALAYYAKTIAILRLVLPL